MTKSLANSDGYDLYRSDAAREFYALKAAALRELAAQCTSVDVRDRFILLSQRYEDLIQICVVSKQPPEPAPRPASIKAAGFTLRAARQAAEHRQARLSRRHFTMN